MKAQDLFILILKIAGIFLIRDVIVSIPPVITSFLQLRALNEDGMAVFNLLANLLSFALKFGIVYFLLFETKMLIRKLHLTSELSEEPLVVNMHRSTVLTIAIIVAGILILVFAIPQLVKNAYGWYEYVQYKNKFSVDASFIWSPLLISLTEVLIGLLFLGNQRTLVNFIELRRRNSEDQAYPDEDTGGQ